VEIEPGKVSTFYFTLPMSSSEDTPDEVIEGEAEMPTIPKYPDSSFGWESRGFPKEKGDSAKKRILIVDDDANIRRSMQFELEKEGYAILESSSGKDALKIAQEAKPDLIILDLLMPELDGYDVLKELREEPATENIPVLVVSIMEDKNNALQLGANDYLMKPINRADLLSTIQSLLVNGEKKILIVDDNTSTVRAIEYELKKNGYETCVAYNGEEGLEVCQKEKPDLVILDIMMPVMNGYEMLKRLRENPDINHIPVIILTANSIKGGRAKAVSLGAQRYITKKEQLKVLFSGIADILQS